VSGAPIAFEVGGVEFVAITAGGRTGPTTSFGPLTNVTLSEGSGAVWVFAASETDPLLSQRRGLTPPIMSRSGVSDPAPRIAAAGNSPASTPVLASRAGANGLFTGAQAARGEQQFKQTCATCHSIEEHAGSLRAKWSDGTLRDLFLTISTTMPQNNPGSLSPVDYASIVAFYLQQSGHSAGSSELSSDPAALREIRIAPP
jgi:mono/diheme cytochrome c family protein